MNAKKSNVFRDFGCIHPVVMEHSLDLKGGVSKVFLLQSTSRNSGKKGRSTLQRRYWTLANLVILVFVKTQLFFAKLNLTKDRCFVPNFVVQQGLHDKRNDKNCTEQNNCHSAFDKTCLHDLGNTGTVLRWILLKVY